MKRLISALFGTALLTGCASRPEVRAEDLQAWVGVPVAMLDKHPLFSVLPVTKTVAADGTEIRNYVNGQAVGGCSSSGTGIAVTRTVASANTNTSCATSFAACNNIFHISGGRVIRYVPSGTGGGSCMTNEKVRPDFSGPANF